MAMFKLVMTDQLLLTILVKCRARNLPRQARLQMARKKEMNSADYP